MTRGKVVRLFVDVQQIRLQFLQLFGQAWIVMQVESSVKSQWDFAEFVTGGVGPFQFLLASIIPPTGPNQHRQFETGSRASSSSLR